MPRDDHVDDDVPARSSGWQRFTAAVSNFMLKPAAEEASGPSSQKDGGPTTVPEIEAAIKRADDKERLIGLLAAPVAAAIGLLITASLIANDPTVGAKHVRPSLYLELGAVTVVLALVMLAMAWFRKRTFLGIAMALYGLSVFNLHYWGFGLPFILAGAWYLVRSYRLSEKLKVAKAGGADGSPGRTGPRPSRPSGTPRRRLPPAGPRSPSRARSSKRAEPPARSPRPGPAAGSVRGPPTAVSHPWPCREPEFTPSPGTLDQFTDW